MFQCTVVGYLIGISHVDPLKWDLTLDGTTKVIATDLRAVQTGVTMPASHDWH